MVFDPTSFPKVLTLYLELSQYPILAPRIRSRMRKELFAKGVISAEAFEEEVREKAIQSQQREGLEDPIGQEPPEVWTRRVSIIRDQLTDFYFAYNLPHERFEAIARQVLTERLPSQDVVLSFHPELAPWDMLFSQGESYEALPPEKRNQVEHHLQEIKVVLIKAMISDHLKYLGIAKRWFDVSDLNRIRERRIGRGKIGGKAAGVMLAECVLRKSAEPELLERLRIPRSWFVGADLFYQYTQLNGLLDYANQKYRNEDDIREYYPSIVDAFMSGSFPEEVVDGLKRILEEAGDAPLIVRSSSLLEDSFGTSFAGKYESYFCPNQQSPMENLSQLLDAIRRVYAGVYNPDVLLYRRRMGLVDYDERMAILIQEVQGRTVGRYYLPDAAGVAFSRNQFTWSPRIDRAAGFMRLVWGLGTRAVETIGGDYPRLVALSHPNLRPESDPKEIRRYSQHKVDVIDLEGNTFDTLNVDEVLAASPPYLRWMAQYYQEGDLRDLVSRPLNLDPDSIVVTFDALLRRTEFPGLIQQALKTLETAYLGPVDVEFALTLEDGDGASPRANLHLLQCRPQSRLQTEEEVELPQELSQEDIIFVVRRLVPDGRILNVRYVVYVNESGYASLKGTAERKLLAGLIGRLNKRLENERYILIGPGRWGSVNPELGVPVTYGDIYHARALIELFSEDTTPEPSYGTHFFQDLVEAQIYPLALGLQDPGAVFNHAFFESSPNVLAKLIPEAGPMQGLVHVIDVPASAAGAHLEVVMNGEAETGIAYLRRGSWAEERSRQRQATTAEGR